MKYELPVHFEQTLGQIKAAYIKAASDYERSVMVEGRVSCRKGCSHCCYYPVLTSIPEALLLYRGITRKRLWTSKLKADFEKAAERVLGLNLEVWMLSKIPCPLLDETNNTCKAYEVRPFSCRTVYTRSDPHYCEPSHSAGLPPLLDRKKAIQSMIETETKLLARHRIGRIVLPLSTSVLLAERLDKGDIDFATLGAIVWKEYILQW